MDFSALSVYLYFLIAANVLLMMYLVFERYRAFRKQGEQIARQLMQEHFEKLGIEENALRQSFRSQMQNVLATTELTGQQMLQQLNDYTIKAHNEHLERFNDFSSKLYSVLVASGNNFSQQLQTYVKDSNVRIDEWQRSYIEIMKREFDTLIQEQRQKLNDFTEIEKQKIQSYIKEQAQKEATVIVEEILSNGITIKDQEKLAQQAVDKFFNEL
ncbi:MAG: hypothetical protein KatS3mg087_0334 [Patescibacteria group bacterium]|nr:MAG: hypothetical protein KatS3mg087_0334 [Patescibacteria group bacterium]